MKFHPLCQIGLFQQNIIGFFSEIRSQFKPNLSGIVLEQPLSKLYLADHTAFQMASIIENRHFIK
jgi:hypothetical protein